MFDINEMLSWYGVAFAVLVAVMVLLYWGKILTFLVGVKHQRETGIKDRLEARCIDRLLHLLYAQKSSAPSQLSVVIVILKDLLEKLDAAEYTAHSKRVELQELSLVRQLPSYQRNAASVVAADQVIRDTVQEISEFIGFVESGKLPPFWVYRANQVTDFSLPQRWLDAIGETVQQRRCELVQRQGALCERVSYLEVVNLQKAEMDTEYHRIAALLQTADATTSAELRAQLGKVQERRVELIHEVMMADLALAAAQNRVQEAQETWTRVAPQLLALHDVVRISNESQAQALAQVIA